MSVGEFALARGGCGEVGGRRQSLERRLAGFVRLWPVSLLFAGLFLVVLGSNPSPPRFVVFFSCGGGEWMRGWMME